MRQLACQISSPKICITLSSMVLEQEGVAPPGSESPGLAYWGWLILSGPPLQAHEGWWPLVTFYSPERCSCCCFHLGNHLIDFVCLEMPLLGPHPSTTRSGPLGVHLLARQCVTNPPDGPSLRTFENLWFRRPSPPLEVDQVEAQVTSQL